MNSPLPIFNWNFFSYLFLRNFYTFWVLTPYQIYSSWIFFFHSIGCFFILLRSFFVFRILLVLDGPICLFLHLCLCFWCQILCFWYHIQKNHCQDWCEGTYLLCFLLGCQYIMCVSLQRGRILIHKIRANSIFENSCFGDR